VEQAVRPVQRCGQRGGAEIRQPAGVSMLLALVLSKMAMRGEEGEKKL
jgi:hypothetical protein